MQSLAASEEKNWEKWTSGEMKDFPDPSLPNTSGISIFKGRIVQGNLGGWSLREGNRDGEKKTYMHRGVTAPDSESFLGRKTDYCTPALKGETQVPKPVQNSVLGNLLV